MQLMFTYEPCFEEESHKHPRRKTYRREFSTGNHGSEGSEAEQLQQINSYLPFRYLTFTKPGSS